jgi:hypothetical protein
MVMPSREEPVWARIWVRPAASAASGPASAFGSPALSRKTIPSSTFGLTLVPLVAASIRGR